MYRRKCRDPGWPPEICYLRKRYSYFMPGFLVSFIKSSPTFTIDYCTFSNVLFYDVINGSIKRFPTGFHTYTQTHCVYSLSQEKAEQFSIYFRLLYNRATSPTYLFTKESITNLLKLPFLELYADYYSTVKEHKVTTLHKEEIGYFFLDLLLKHYKENKEVAFYAEKLHVSSKYLTEALTLVSGKSPKEWIIHYTLQEIYALLENPSISIQEIVQRTRFANLATLRRFFKRHTGTSLLQYRKQDLYKNNTIGTSIKNQPVPHILPERADPSIYQNLLFSLLYSNPAAFSFFTNSSLSTFISSQSSSSE